MFYTGVIRDTTEQKQLETQFRQAQKMEAVGRLAGGVAHDFNNLLTAILGFSEFAMRKLPPDSAFLRTDLEEIRNAAKRAATLTRQLLIFSRQQVTQPQRVDVNDLLRDLDKMLRRFIGEDIELVFVPAQELEAVMIDPGQLEQVVVNLVVNARDAMPTGGTLIIETGTAILDEEYARLHPEVTTGRYVMLTVSDTGTGMTEEVKSRLFEPFFTTKAAGKGTGLGLATCYGIVRQARGYIGVYSEPGQGTVFKVYLPCAEAAAPGQLPPVEKGGTLPRGTETVLLVEDDLSVRGMAVRVLQTQGYTVLEATDGEDALRLVQEYTGGRIRLVVTDVVMPRMSGRELVERLVTVYPGLKVLYMSGYTDDAIIRHGVLEEGTPFLQKPFTVTDLARRVREVMDAPQELKTGR
jgi:nitrogen-specific signal transduction histidine kinase/ActR/RegA family two-component response regulator